MRPNDPEHELCEGPNKLNEGKKMNWLQKEKWGVFFKSVIWTVLITFSFETFGFQSAAYAQSYLQSLPMPGTMINLSPAYAPVLLKGIKTYPDNPFRFDFFIDPGEEHLDNKGISEESNKLIKYFLASLTVPENDLWVNLSPYEKDRIMPTGFGTTEMGRDLLAQDYLLKQISASLLDPTKPRGEEFWKKIYAKANLPESSVNTFNKVWIVPDSAEVYTKDGNAFVVDSHLKVMLEGDLTPPSPLFKKEGEGGIPSVTPFLDKEGVGGVLNTNVSSQPIRDIIIPAIEKEVNEGENFAMLRQIYHAMILATWFKRHLRESLFSKVYVGQNKVSGVDVDDKQIKEKIYQQYLAAFKKGVFNFIREDFDETTQESVPRKYFAGGVSFTNFSALAGSSAVSAYRETDNPQSLRALKLRPVGFLGAPFYRVSSVVVNGQGVDWYNSMNLTALASAASAVVQDLQTPTILSVKKLFGNFSLRKAVGVAFATVALFSSLGFANQVQAAQFSYDGNRGMIVHIEKNDTLGSIVQTLKAQEAKVNSTLLSGNLWGKGGAVEKVAQAMQLSDKDTIVAGKSYVIPSSFLSTADHGVSQGKAQSVEKLTFNTPQPVSNVLSPAVSIAAADTSSNNEFETSKVPMTPALALLTDGFRLPLGAVAKSPAVQSPGEFVGPIPQGYYSPHPDIPLTLTSLLLSGLAWSQRIAMQRSATIYQFPSATAKVRETQKSLAPKTIVETQFTRNLILQIRSLSLDYLQAENEIKTQAKTFVEIISGDFRQRLLQENLWSVDKVENTVRKFSQALREAIESAGLTILDSESLDTMIRNKASDLQADWALSGQQDLNADGKLDVFIESELNATVAERLENFRKKTQVALDENYRAIYLQATAAAIVLYAQVMPSAEPLDDILKNSLKEISQDLSGVFGVSVDLQKPAAVLTLKNQKVNKSAVLQAVRQQSLALQTADARLNNHAKVFAGQIGHELVALFAPLKLSTKTPQPDPSGAVRQYFVPAISRFWLTGLYQRYDANEIENLLNDFVQDMQARFEGQDIDSLEVQNQIDAFVGGVLASTISRNIDAAVKSLQEQVLTAQWREIYQAALVTSVQIERAIANGSGVLVVPTVQKAVAELASVLEEDHGLAALPFLTGTMSTALAEESLEILQVDSQSLPAESKQEPSRAPPVSFAALDGAILTATALGMLVTGQTDLGAVATAMASPFLFRGGLTASYWLHEFSHVLAGGRGAWTKENLRGNIRLKEWLSMLIPFTGRIAPDAKVKVPGTSKISAWFNRLTGFGTSVGIVAGLGATLAGLWQAGMHGEVFSFVPVLWGSLTVALGSFKTDVIAPLKKESSDCEFNCGVAIIVSQRDPQDKSIVPEETREDFKATGVVTDIRGQQAAGVKILAVNAQGTPVWVGDRMVNDKRGDLPQSLDTRMTQQEILAKARGYKPARDYNVLIGHYRYGTSSAPKKIETHPHQWMPDRKVKLWSIGLDGKLVETDRILGMTIVHNGDFDYWKFNDAYQANGDIGLWLMRILHTINDAQGDSPKIAGMMDYLRTQGLWDAAARFAFYETQKDTFNYPFDGKLEKIQRPDPNQPGAFIEEVVSKNTALPAEVIEEFATRFREVFRREGAKLVNPGDTDLKSLWSDDRQNQRTALVNQMADNLKGMDIVQDWSRKKRLRFVQAALEAFLLNDEEQAARIFIDRAQGSFGLGIGSTLKPDGVILVADGQPLAIGLDAARKKLHVVSEPSALKIRMRNETHLDYRLTLRQNIGRGEIVNVSGSRNMTIYSRDKGRYLTQEEIDSRLVPLQNNPYIMDLPVLNSDDPVADDIRDSAPVMAAIKAHWDNPDSPNRQTARNILHLLVAKKIEHQLRGFSEAYAAFKPRVSQKADDIAFSVREDLIRVLKASFPNEVDWDAVLDLQKGSARFSLLLEGALSVVVDSAAIEEMIRQKASEISETLLAGKIDADQARIAASDFARNNLNKEIELQLRKAGQHVQSAVNSWQKVVQADLILQAKRGMMRAGQQSMAQAGQTPFDRIEQLWLSLGIKPGFTAQKQGEDIVLTGLEISQWVSEELMTSLKQVFPELKIKAESSNKILEDPIAAGIDDHTIVLAISQSGQTFPTLNAAIALEQLSAGRVFAVTGEWDTLLGQAVGQQFMPESPFSGRIISNLTGFRPSEAASLTETATHVTLTELLLRLSEDLSTVFPSEKPFGMTLTPLGIAKLKELRDVSIDEIARITGVNKDGKPFVTQENTAINTQAKKWAGHVLDEPFSKILTTAHLLLAVIGGFLIFPLLAKLLPFAIALPFVLGAQYLFFEFFKYTTTLGLRWMQGRTLLARSGKRTIVIGDRSYIHQSLEIFLSKLNSLSKSATAVDVHGANPGDHMVARFGHRVVRGSLIWLGVTDGRLGGKLAEWQGSIGMTGKQAKGVRNYGVGAEVVAVGRQRSFNKNATDVDITIQGDVSGIPSELAMLYEGRFDSLTRLVAGQVFFYRMMRIVSTLDLSPGWRRLWPWGWKMNRTQSGPRIATTASPRSAPDYNKFVKIAPEELPLGLHENHDERLAVKLTNTPAQASSSAVQTAQGSSAPGGIDLNPSMLKLNVTGDSFSSPVLAPEFLLDPQELNAMPADRFVPLIIEVVPINSVDMFLGMAPARSAKNPEVALAVP